MKISRNKNLHTLIIIRVEKKEKRTNNNNKKRKGKETKRRLRAEVCFDTIFTHYFSYGFSATYSKCIKNEKVRGEIYHIAGSDTELA